MSNALHPRGLGYGIIIVDPNPPIDCCDALIPCARKYAQGAEVCLTSGFRQLGRSSAYMRLTELLSAICAGYKQCLPGQLEVQPPSWLCREARVAGQTKHDIGLARHEYTPLHSPGSARPWQ